jgi:uncharacterized protein YfiM (DUF2279 family)
MINPDLLAIAEHLVPDANLDDARLATGQFHDVVLLPGVAAVRIARREAAEVKLPRRTELLAHLAALDLPFAVPAPLGAAQRVDGRMAVAVSWVDGAGSPCRCWKSMNNCRCVRSGAMSTIAMPACAITLDSPNDAKSTSWPAALAAQAMGTSG